MSYICRITIQYLPRPSPPHPATPKTSNARLFPPLGRWRYNRTRARNIYPPHSSLIYSTSVSEGVSYVCGGDTSAREEEGLLFLFYFFPPSNPSVFFSSRLDVSDSIFYRLGSAHSDNLLFLHPLTRKYGARPMYTVSAHIIYT